MFNIIFILISIIFASEKKHNEYNDTFYLIESKEVQRTIIERGVIICKESVPVKVMGGAGLEGERALSQIKYIIPHNSIIEPNQILVTVDDHNMKDVLKKTLLTIQTYEVKTKSYKADADFIKYEEKLKAEQDKEILSYKIYEKEVKIKGLTESERRLLDIDIELAKIDLEQSEQDYERQKKLYEKNYISQATLDSYERKYRIRKVKLNELIIKKDVKKQGIPKEEIIELTESVKHAKANVERGQDRLNRRVGENNNKISSNQLNITRENYKLEHIKRLLQKANVYSNCKGIVLVKRFQDWRKGGDWVRYRTGCDMSGSVVVADIVNPDSIVIELQVSELDAKNVKVGMPVRIHLPSYPDRMFLGKITKLGGIGRDRYDIALNQEDKALTGVTVFNVTVEFDNIDARCCPGMSAVVEIILDKSNRGLIIPRSAVCRGKHRFYVFVKYGDDIERVNIEGIYYNEQYFLVVKGLEEGVLIHKYPNML